MIQKSNYPSVALPPDIIAILLREMVALYDSGTLGTRRQRRLAICIDGLSRLDGQEWTNEKLEALLRHFDATTGGAFLRLAVARRQMNQVLPHALIGAGAVAGCAMHLFASGWLSGALIVLAGAAAFLLLSRLFRVAFGLTRLHRLSYSIDPAIPIFLDVPSD